MGIDALMPYRWIREHKCLKSRSKKRLLQSPVDVAKNPFDAMMPAYERWALPVSTQIAEVILQQLGDLAGKRILDVGAGVGSFAVPASRAGAQVVAIDSAPAMVGRLRERLAPFPQSRAEIQSVRDLPAGEPEYDVVASIFSAAFTAGRAGCL